MKKWLCTICGYIIENEKIKICPICNAPYKEFKKFDGNQEVFFNNIKNVGVAQETDENMIYDLRSIFSRECLEVGMYLAMSKIAYKEGYSKVCDVYKTIAYEEADHAAILAELLGDVVKTWTKENVKKIIDDEYNATQNKLKLAKRAKELGLDTIHNILNEMCKDEVRHSKQFLALLNEYFDE